MSDTPVSLLDRLCHHPEPTDWERFVRLFTPQLHRWAVRLGVPATDAEDLVQDVFLVLFRRLPEFRYDPSRSFRGWLWTVFHHSTLAWREKQSRRPPTLANLEEFQSPDAIDEAAEAEFQRVLLDRILLLLRADFPESTWQMFWKTAVEGKSGVEVADELGVSANAVYLARGRILARLREELANFGE